MAVLDEGTKIARGRADIADRERERERCALPAAL